jgi:hypothetical protein
MVLFFLFFLFNPISVYADEFNTTGDTSSNSFFHTTAITKDNNLEIKDIETMLNVRRRYPGVHDSVGGEPGTKIYLWYMYSNETGHTVDIRSIAIPLSKTNGNISNLIDVNHDISYAELQIVYAGKKISRASKYLYYEGVLDIPNEKKDIYIIDTWYIKDSLERNIQEIKVENDIIKIKVLLKNTTGEYWNNIVFKHYGYENSFNLQAGEEKLLEYEILYTKQNTLNGFEIYNPNTKMGCAILGSGINQWYSTQAITLFAKRENDIWIQGAYVQPSLESFCIQRLPYTIHSYSIKLSNEEETEEEKQEVLGVEDNLETLPKTGYNIVYPSLLFLVIDIILWYSFLRRLHTNECKGKDSRLCTKSCKNVR